MMEINSVIQYIMYEQIGQKTVQNILLSKSFITHSIAESINEFQRKHLNNDAIYSILDELHAKLNELRSVGAIFDKIEINLFNLIDRFVDKSHRLRDFFGSLVVTNTTTKPIFIKSNENLLMLILDSLRANILDAAKDNLINDPKMEIKAEEFEKIVLIKITDNVGGYDALNNAVNAVNAGVSVESTRGKDRGEGLEIIRKIIHQISGIEQDWILDKGYKENKTLSIPLAKIVES
jgi:hypothetical protein